MGGKIFLAAILVLILVAIALSPVDHALLYEDQLYELDLFSRCNDIEHSLKAGNASPYVRRHLEVLREEIDALDPGDASLAHVNEIYLQCIDLLIAAADAKAVGNTEKASLALSQAETHFALAEQQLAQYRRAFG